METVKREYKVFKYDELSEEAKDKAIEELQDINVDHDWWNDYECFGEIAKKYGIDIDIFEATFSLDRENFVAFDTYNHSQKKDWNCPISIPNVKEFCKIAGVKYKCDEVSIEHTHYTGGYIKNYIEVRGEYTDKDEDKFQIVLDSMLEELLSELHKVYDGLTNRESIEETIRANEYDFFENGKLFNL